MILIVNNYFHANYNFHIFDVDFALSCLPGKKSFRNSSPG